jgi:hypothetical protein
MQPAADRFDELLDGRRRALPHLKAGQQRWQRAARQIEALQAALTALRTHPDAPPELDAQLAGLDTAALAADIAGLIQEYAHTMSRFARGTVNIGVSGQARVGKSTLLQSLTGLTSESIPTGSGVPVTAVRSRLFNTQGPSRAVLQLHTPESFLDAYVRPYHRALGIAVPDSLAEFAAWRYPERVADSLTPYLQRVVTSQRALPSYRGDLTGGRREIALKELRPYIAYPLQSQAESGNPERRYLAVHEARIECTFPQPGVGRLGIVDLPGLGEAAPGADDRHVDGLRHEVDAVLLLKRPVEGLAYYGETDARVLSLLDEARGLVRRTGDFVFVVVNRGLGDDEALVVALRSHLNTELNAGVADSHFTVLEADAASPGSVAEDLLAPLLDALGQRLPGMDSDLIEGLDQRAAALAEAATEVTGRIRAAVNRTRAGTSAPAEELDTKAAELRKSLASDLTVLVRELQAQAESEAEDPEYLDAIRTAHQRLYRWLQVGLGAAEPALGASQASDAPVGTEQIEEARKRWLLDCLRTMTAEHASAAVAVPEFNRIRVAVGRHFATIDQLYFHDRVLRLYAQVAETVRLRTGVLLGTEPITPETAQATLALLHQLLLDGFEPCVDLAAAVHDLLMLRLDYRTQLHPRVRRQLNELVLEIKDPSTEVMIPQITVPLSESGAEQLYGFLQIRAEQAADATRKALLDLAVLPAQVLFAAVEQFEDTLNRSGRAELEYKRLARSYRAELWPEHTAGLGSGHARFAAVQRACEGLDRIARGADADAPNRDETMEEWQA